jgi:F420H(2)-dependent quinone reductase
MKTNQATKRQRLPPRWFVRAFWYCHRALLRSTGARFGLWQPKPNGWGALRVTTIGRRSGRKRRVVLGYIEDGPDLIVLAMNGWAEGEPAWWLNLQAHPDVEIDLVGGRHRAITARAAEGAERDRLWARWKEIEKGDLDDYAARRSGPTAVVVLELRSV